MRSGAFLLPYALALFTCGIPLFFLEVSLGQMTGQGGITCWKKICPLFEGLSPFTSNINHGRQYLTVECVVFSVTLGLGYGSQVLALFTIMYYIIILAWAFLYLFNSFQTTLPWASCNNTWNTGNNAQYTVRVL